MSHAEKSVRKWPWLIRYGFLIALVSGALWAGKYIVSAIEFVLPFTLGLGVVLMLLGWYGEVKRREGTNQSSRASEEQK